MDIKKYEIEIEYIINELKDIENGCFYENGCQKNRGAASAKTIAKNVRTEFISLMKKIKDNSPGMFEEIK